MHIARSLFASLFVALVPVAASAQYPIRPVKIVVATPPGGAPDVAARLLADQLSKSFGQPVVVENRQGANGNIAADAVAKAPPDGYTLLLGQDSTFVVNPHLYSRLSYDPGKDLAPVASVASNQFILAVNPAIPAKTLPELIDYARKAEPPLAYASGGNGSQHHLGMELLKQRSGINLTHIPYKGGAPAAVATVAGETAVLFAGAASAGSIRGGQLRALAVTGPKRSNAFPDVPTIGEFYPGYSISIWLGLFAPAGTPEPIIGTLRREVHRLLASPEIQEKLNVSGSLDPLILEPSAFAELITHDHERFGKIVKELGLKVD